MNNLVEYVSCKEMYTEEELFRKEYTNVVKAFGIILMISQHLFTPEWMIFPKSLLDFKINNYFVSTIVTRGGDICIGVFAFVTGYGWAVSFEKKSRFERILGVGGGTGAIG